MDFYELLSRAEQGNRITKDKWDFDNVVLRTRDLVEKYQIAWDPQTIIPTNVELVDRVFLAGLELAQKTGIYAIHTGRVIKFSRDELECGLKLPPESLEMGAGADKRRLIVREIEDPRPPAVWGGNPGAPTPEHVFLPTIKSWMQEPVVDMVTCGSLTHVDGRPVSAGESTEILATRRELTLLREGLRQVNRPGMGLLAAQSAMTEIGDLSVSQPDYLRPGDAHLVPLLNELIIDRISLSRVANSIDYGMKNASLACAMVGGLGGDAPGTAIVQVASFILANLVCRADYHLLHPIHIRHVATSTRSVMWVQSIVQQAFIRNAPCIIVSDIYPKSGAMTRELLYEIAANTITITVSGGHLEGVGAADGARPNSTGLDVRWMGEVGHAVARSGMGRDDANTLIQHILTKYEHVFDLPDGNPGSSFEKAYDLETLKPLPAWMRIYDYIREEMIGIGLKFDR